MKDEQPDTEPGADSLAAEARIVAAKALEWYRDEALALALNLAQQRQAAVVAGVTVLSNDAGNRAITALALLERSRVLASPEQSVAAAEAPSLRVGHLHANGDFCVEQMPHELLHHWPVPLFALSQAPAEEAPGKKA